MDKQPVGQLPDLAQSNNDDEIMVITNSEYSQLKKEKISDLITDFTSTNENNALTKGTDGKMFVTDFGNASNITEGTLPTSVLPDIPKSKLPDIETADLPLSGVTADTYAYPSSVTVNAQGQVTAIEEGSPSGANANTDLSNLTELGEKHFLNKSQITNCILSAPNGVATYSGGTITVKQGLKVLIPNGRNADGTLNNIEYTLQSDVSVSLPSDRNGIEFISLTNNGELSYWNTNDVGYIYKEPQSNLNWKYYDKDNNIYKYTINGAPYVDSLEVPVLLANVTNGVINSLTPYQPVELLKRSDLEGKLNADVDGQWVYKSVNLSNNNSAGTTVVDLSDELPNDGYNYEILISCGAQGKNQAATSQVFLTSSIIENITAIGLTGSSIYQFNTFNIPVGTDRTLSITKTGQLVGIWVEMYGYRRLGKNN